MVCATCRAACWPPANVPFARGEQDVKEAFTEFVVPLGEGHAGARQLNVNAAARWADYSGAGQVQSWKEVSTGQCSSRYASARPRRKDVRAPTMGEKFDRTGGISIAFTDLGIVPNPSPYSATQYSNTSNRADVLDDGLAPEDIVDPPEDAKGDRDSVFSQANYLGTC